MTEQNDPRLLTDEEIGNLEWNSADLEMRFVEAHPKEIKAILQAQLNKADKLDEVPGDAGYPVDKLDELESLTCPVLIEAQDLGDIIQQGKDEEREKILTELERILRLNKFWQRDEALSIFIDNLKEMGGKQ